MMLIEKSAARDRNNPAPAEEAGAADILVARGTVSVVTLNRPAKRNAMTLAMWGRLGEIFASLGADAAVRAIILTGRDSFSAGADISEFKHNRATPAQAEAYEAVVDATLTYIHDAPKPVIAAIESYCIGGGLALAQACDFRVADPSAIFGVPAARLGIVYSLNECRSLAAIVGNVEAKRILFSGANFGAAHAAHIGLVELAEENHALEAAMLLATGFCLNAPLSLSGMKFILNAVAAGNPETRGGEIESHIQRALASDDYREAVSAFQEKRKAVFRGS